MTTDSDRSLTNTLRVHRARLGWTQEQLAREIGVSRKTITTIETGRFMPSTWLALKLASALGASVEDLFQIEGEAAGMPAEERPWYLRGPD